MLHPAPPARPRIRSKRRHAHGRLKTPVALRDEPERPPDHRSPHRPRRQPDGLTLPNPSYFARDSRAVPVGAPDRSAGARHSALLLRALPLIAARAVQRRSQPEEPVPRERAVDRAFRATATPARIRRTRRRTAGLSGPPSAAWTAEAIPVAAAVPPAPAPAEHHPPAPALPRLAVHDRGDRTTGNSDGSVCPQPSPLDQVGNQVVERRIGRQADLADGRGQAELMFPGCFRGAPALGRPSSPGRHVGRTNSEEFSGCATGPDENGATTSAVDGAEKRSAWPRPGWASLASVRPLAATAPAEDPTSDRFANSGAMPSLWLAAPDESCAPRVTKTLAPPAFTGSRRPSCCAVKEPAPRAHRRASAVGRNRGGRSRHARAAVRHQGGYQQLGQRCSQSGRQTSFAPRHPRPAAGAHRVIIRARQAVHAPAQPASGPSC